MTLDGFQVVEGWEVPDGIEFPTHRLNEISSWDQKVLDWYGHVEMLHQLELEGIDTDLLATGVDQDNVQYAAVKATVSVGGQSFSAVGGADTTSQQVRDPEHVFSVAESRALKRAAKKAIPMRPEKGGSRTPEHDQAGDIPDPELDPDRVINRDDDSEPMEPESADEIVEAATRDAQAEQDDDVDW